MTRARVLTTDELLKIAGQEPSSNIAQPKSNITPAIGQLSNEELLNIAGINGTGSVSTQAELKEVEAEQPTLLQKTTRGFGQFAKGLASGVENVGLGILQTAADLGVDFQGARSILATLRPDLEKEIMSFTSEDISSLIGERVGEKKRRAEEEGLAFKAGEIGAEIAPFLPVGAKAGLIKGGALGGAAVSGLAAQERPEETSRIGEAAIGAGVGGLTGGLLRGAGVGARAIKRGVKRLTTATKPEDILAARLPEGQTAQLLDQLKTATPDSPVILPDIAGDEVQGLTRAVGKLSGGGKDVISEALETRSVNAVERVANQLAKDISSVDSYFGSLDDIAKARSKVAAPFYEKAFARRTTLDPVKDAALLDKIAPDIKAARSKFRIGEEVADNSIVMLDSAKKTLDDKIGRAIRQGENQEARALQSIKSELVTKLDELNPDYKKAREIFSDFSSIETAQKEGLDFAKKTPEELKSFFKKLSTGEKDAFRIGVRENLQRIVAKTPEGADPSKRIFGNSLKRKQLKAVFKDDKSFKDFERRMTEEINAADTKFKVLGGSRTDINIANDAQFIDEVVRGGRALTGSKTELLGALATSLKNRAAGLSNKNAKELAQILVSKEKSIKALENILKKEQSGVQKRLVEDILNQVRPSIITSKTLTED
jgi:hypothetical protein